MPSKRLHNSRSWMQPAAARKSKMAPISPTRFVKTKQPPAIPPNNTLSNEIWLGRKPMRASHRAVAAAHLLSLAFIGRRVKLCSLMNRLLLLCGAGCDLVGDFKRKIQGLLG